MIPVILQIAAAPYSLSVWHVFSSVVPLNLIIKGINLKKELFFLHDLLDGSSLLRLHFEVGLFYLSSSPKSSIYSDFKSKEISNFF